MAVSSGSDFKAKYGTTFYLVLDDNLKHRNLPYKLGLNKFNPNDDYERYIFKKGLHFTNLGHLLRYTEYGPNIGIVRIPDDALVYEHEFIADRIILEKVTCIEKEILELYKLSRDNGCPWGKLICNNAALNGHLYILKWARKNACPWDESTCANAALNGHLEVLKWARENGCPWDDSTCNRAAENGHLEVLKWAREHGCHWNESTCAWAANNGHLEVLKWARENGCPWDESTCDSAVAEGQLEVLKWARENGCPCGGEYHKN